MQPGFLLITIESVYKSDNVIITDMNRKRKPGGGIFLMADFGVGVFLTFSQDMNQLILPGDFFYMLKIFYSGFFW